MDHWCALQVAAKTEIEAQNFKQVLFSCENLLVIDTTEIELGICFRNKSWQLFCTGRAKY